MRDTCIALIYTVKHNEVASSRSGGTESSIAHAVFQQ